MTRVWELDLPDSDPRSGCGTFQGGPSKRIESSMRNSLYFIADQRRRYVKIGISRDPERRLHDLQAGSPIPLHIVLVIPGNGKAEEEALHQYFAKHWSHREWFKFAPEIADLVNNLADGATVSALVPPAPFPNGIAWEWGGLATKAETMAALKKAAVK
jgi:hypothetical protein